MHRRLQILEDGKQVEDTYRFTILETRKWDSAASMGLVNKVAR